MRDSEALIIKRPLYFRSDSENQPARKSNTRPFDDRWSTGLGFSQSTSENLQFCLYSNGKEIKPSCSNNRP